jgi:hypothetical protein
VTEFRQLMRFQFRSVRRGVVALALLSPLLGACSSSMSSFSSMFGSGTAAGDANATAAAPLALPNDFECPSVMVRSGAATLSSSIDASDETATGLRYQVGLGNTARECRMVAPGVVSVKIGVQGRAILGPQGTPGTIDVPIRFAVVYDGVPPRTIATRLDRVQVNVTQENNNVQFSHVAEPIEFPLPKRSEMDQYVVYIGFDAVGAQQNERKKPAPRPAKPKRQMSQG